MGKFRFLHAADVHLGSMLHMEGAGDPALIRYCREATYMAFERLCRITADSDARFLLISGDLYDRESRSVRANRFFADACEKLDRKGIGVYVIAGNHDPIREYQEMFALPPNVHIFRADEPEICYVEEDGEILAGIVGQSYQKKWESAAMHRGFPAPDGGCFAIAMLHTQMDADDKKYVPCTVGELAGNPSIHYWALGHIHQPAVLKGDKPVIAYSGIPQGRDFGEEGPGGCWLVEVDGTEITDMRYLMTSPVIFQSVPIDIGCTELREAENLSRLEEYMAGYARNMQSEFPALPGRGISPVYPQGAGKPEGYIVRWILTGRGNLHHILSGDRPEIGRELCETLRDRLSGLEPFVWTDSMDIRTGSPATEDILNQHKVLRDLLEQSIRSIDRDEGARERFLHELGQIWTTSRDQEEQDDRKLTLDEEAFRAILEDARQLLIENLAAEGE